VFLGITDKLYWFESCTACYKTPFQIFYLNYILIKILEDYDKKQLWNYEWQYYVDATNGTLLRAQTTVIIKTYYHFLESSLSLNTIKHTVMTLKKTQKL